MSFPNIENKHLNDAFFSPSDYIKYERDNNLVSDFKIPNGALFIYSKRLQDKILEGKDFNRIASFFKGDFFILKDYSVGILNVGVGAPAITIAMEELIALGVKKFFSIGTAGGIQKTLKSADIIVCDKAIRDEGVSHHYLGPSKYIEISGSLTNLFCDELIKNNLEFKMGATWTIDAPYRETVQELQTYQAEGVMAVDMEAAALAAVSKLRKAEFATAFVISDLFGELEWNPQFRIPEVLENLHKLSEIAIKLLST